METRLCLIQHQIVSQIKFYSLNSSKNKCSTNKYAFIIWLTLYTLIGAADTPSINPFNASPTFSYKNYIQDINHIKYVLLAVNTLECIFQLTNSCLIWCNNIHNLQSIQAVGLNKKMVRYKSQLHQQRHMSIRN